MKIFYEYDNAIVFVENPDTYDLKNMKNATELFLKRTTVYKAKRRCDNGNHNSTRNICKK